MIVRDAEGICGSVLKKAFLVSKLRDLCAINDILVLDISYPLRPQWTIGVFHFHLCQGFNQGHIQ